jgi:hypothetical protein
MNDLKCRLFIKGPRNFFRRKVKDFLSSYVSMVRSTWRRLMAEQQATRDHGQFFLKKKMYTERKAMLSMESGKQRMKSCEGTEGTLWSSLKLII